MNGIFILVFDSDLLMVESYCLMDLIEFVEQRLKFRRET